MKHRGDNVTALKAETDQTRRRYQRLSWIYDGLDAAFELKYRAWRADLWQSVEGKRVLEAGIGTGKNIPYFGLDHEVPACLMGVHINRQTIENVAASGLEITSANEIWAGGIYKRLTARVP